jgi:methionyl-tRNA formyltransferase
MRMVYFANNRLAWQILCWLKKTDVEIVGLVLHPGENRKWGEELLDAAGVPEQAVFTGSMLGDAGVLERIRALAPDLGLSVLFGTILQQPLLSLFPDGVWNLHPAYLPFNRGSAPNVWSIVEGTPAGVTLHRIDAGVDTGDILAQEAVPVDLTDTGESLYRKLETASLALFQRAWPQFCAGELKATPQVPTTGTVHRDRDLGKIDEIDLDREYKARDLINLVRARSFAGYRGAYFQADGKKVHLRLELEYGD